MSADTLLARLDGARQVSAGRWRAPCPAHDGRNRDVLSISEGNDGSILVKCFAGCSASEIVAAVGLELHDLFPKVNWQTSGKHAAVGRPLRKYAADQANHSHLSQVRRPRVDWPAMIGACERDLLLAKVVLARIARGEPIDDTDASACQAAATRLFALIGEARCG